MTRRAAIAASLLALGCGEAAAPAADARTDPTHVRAGTAVPRGRAAFVAPEAISEAAAEDVPLPASPHDLVALLLAPETPDERREEIRRALRALGRAATSALLPLLDLEPHAAWAAGQLCEFGAPPDAADALARCLERFPSARANAEVALGDLGIAGAVAAAPLLRSPDPAVRASATNVLGREPYVPPEHEGALVACVADPDAAVRRGAAFAVRAVRRSRADACRALLRAAADADRAVASAALRTLAEAFPDEAAQHAAALVAEAERTPDRAASVADVLAAIGPDAVLLGLASQESDVVRASIRAARPDDARVRDRVLALAADTDRETAGEALRFAADLDDVPDAAGAAAASLLAAAGDPRGRDASGARADARVRIAAVRVVAKRVGAGAASGDVLEPSLADPELGVRGAAAVALVASAPPSELARRLASVEPLWRTDATALPDDARIRLAAAVAGRVGAPSEAMAWLCDRADRGEHREAAVHALGELRLTAATTALLSQLDVLVWNVREAAVSALAGHLADARVVPALLGQLRDAPRATVRAAAATSLAGAAGRGDVRAALETASSQDPHRLVRSAAAEALRDD